MSFEPISNEEADAILETRTAPRITRESIEAGIADITFFFKGQLTVCVVTMDNGFMCVGKAAPASPENFNQQLGEKFAYEDCIKQLFPLEGYRLCEDLFRGRVTADDNAQDSADDTPPGVTGV